MINIRIHEGFGVVGIILGVGSAIWALCQTKKVSDTTNQIGIALKDVSSKTPVDIKQAFVDKAVERAVDREVKKAIQDSSKLVTRQIRSDMDSMIRKDVDTAYSDIRGSVEDRVTSAVSEIDIEALKSGIQQKVKDKMVNELWNLSGIGKIFSSGSSGSRPVSVADLNNLLDKVPWSEDRTKIINNWLTNGRG